jgi:hypothetical protein
MVLPLLPVLVIIVKVVAVAMTLNELHDSGKSILEGVEAFEKNIETIKDKLREYIQSLQDEIEKNVNEKAELAYLHGLVKGDRRIQSETTKKALGRRFGKPATDPIIAAITQKIPYRKLISMVCEQADKTPAFSLRRKKGVDIKDAIKIKKEIAVRLLSLTLEELDLIDDIDGFIIVRLKQLVVSIVFELIDNVLEWASPLKAEACFGKGKYLGETVFKDPKLTDPKQADGATTCLYRSGAKLNPFFPPPHGRGSISADLSITDYRKEPLSQKNLFALIEIKFKGDKPGDDQFKNYRDLSKACATAKNNVTPFDRTNGTNGVSKGCLVSLFRYPEDVAVEPPDDGKNKKKKPGDTSTPPKKHGKPARLFPKKG